ncbi:rRNA maturation RNase YbeY [Galactobacter caseinivorans]|uniref:Endoribonuclease YbeY n=1 Tax=Galactobacter caseinivorans TaxID=2676123 RepID=A0A496PL63_9MICC|nr:rRNA maturation RNase YbeY [Galactobacter caseinivorans]RKW71157.1 rRNA maturation RNase YbeY [Galactobacter caseinivorans]
MSVEVSNESGQEVDLEELTALAGHVMDALYVHPDAEVSIVLYDEEAMAALHVKWMDLAGPTDVMSFPMDELRPGTPSALSGPGFLGDIVLCPTIAADQAKRGGHSTQDELDLLTTHGMLHLLGYDHAEPEEKTEMFGLQRELLEGFLGRPAPKETIQ